MTKITTRKTPKSLTTRTQTIGFNKKLRKLTVENKNQIPDKMSKTEQQYYNENIECINNLAFKLSSEAADKETQYKRGSVTVKWDDSEIASIHIEKKKVHKIKGEITTTKVVNLGWLRDCNIDTVLAKVVKHEFGVKLPEK